GLRCATGTSGLLAQIKRKPSANQRANHFFKDVRCIGNGAQTILPAAQTIWAGRANHFASCASHLGWAAQTILARSPPIGMAWQGLQHRPCSGPCDRSFVFRATRQTRGGHATAPFLAFTLGPSGEGGLHGFRVAGPQGVCIWILRVCVYTGRSEVHLAEVLVQREGCDVGEETDALAVDTAPGRQSEPFAAAMLVVACLCWAAFFSLCKNWQEAARACPGGELVASLTLLAVRTLIALAAFVVLKPRLFLKPSRHEIAVGLLLGTLNCLGNIFQVWGLASTSPALSGFFTSLASLWVPILAFVCFRLPVARVTWAGMALGVAGLAILGIP